VEHEIVIEVAMGEPGGHAIHHPVSNNTVALGVLVLGDAKLVVFFVDDKKNMSVVLREFPHGRVAVGVVEDLGTIT
jgi:hypothetical protein